MFANFLFAFFSILCLMCFWFDVVITSFRKSADIANRRPGRRFIERKDKEQNAPGGDGSDSARHSEHVNSQNSPPTPTIHIAPDPSGWCRRRFPHFYTRLQSRKDKWKFTIPIIAIKFYEENRSSMFALLRCLLRRFRISWKAFSDYLSIFKT